MTDHREGVSEDNQSRDEFHRNLERRRKMQRRTLQKVGHRNGQEYFRGFVEESEGEMNFERTNETRRRRSHRRRRYRGRSPRRDAPGTGRPS